MSSLWEHSFIELSAVNSRESMNMVTPAMQLASKIPDIHVQLWATALLKGNFAFNRYYSINSYIITYYIKEIVYN